MPAWAGFTVDPQVWEQPLIRDGSDEDNPSVLDMADDRALWPKLTSRAIDLAFMSHRSA